jgi:putative ABC transport system ATP-binding protein
LTLRAGERVALAGPSGAGKTLVLRAVALLDPIDSGRIAWGEDQQDIAIKDIPSYRQRVIYLQQRAAMSDGTVEDNLRLPFSFAASRGKSYQRDRVVSWLSSFGRDAQFLNKSARQLSGGETQIVALVRALQLDPQVLLLDEATAALDAEATDAFIKLVEAWLHEQAQSRACLWVTHDVAQRASLADRQVTIVAGSIVSQVSG